MDRTTMNRLAGSRSPYLAMHATDPVDWYPWGTEAFERARAEDKLIFLSSGFASCHWCHVMQRESFRDEETARLLNERFVPVKVDREVRPDVDGLYMDYVAATTGGGGWPMSVFLTPRLVPIFGGTFFAKRAPEGLPSFTDVLEMISEVYRDEPDNVKTTEEGALSFLRGQAAPRSRRRVTRREVDDAADSIIKYADQENGGFGDQPKFPHAPLVSFLLSYHELTGDSEALRTAEEAVRAVVRGALFDQVGGGLHRYAVDAEWKVPHFEKMLYDQALLLSSLAAIHNASQDTEWMVAARRTAGFLAQEMESPGGGFYSSLDAETEGVEGAPYTWRWTELEAILTPGQLDLARAYLGATEEGAWHGTNILSRRLGRQEDAEAVDEVLDLLADLRARRAQPKPDTKVITSWNSLAVRGLIEAGFVMNDPAMRDLGFSTLETLLTKAVAGDGGVLRVLDDPSSEDIRLLDDHAALASACLAAHRLLGRKDMFEIAQSLHEKAVSRFAEDGEVYMTPSETELPVRPKEQQDAPTPSGASLAADNALHLYVHTEEPAYLEFAEEVLAGMWELVEFAPEHAGHALAVACRLLELRPEES